MKIEGVENWEECQKLCQLVNGCNFFNYGGEAAETAEYCYLKYGLGRQKTGVKNRQVFGPQHCPGWFLVHFYPFTLCFPVDCVMKNSSTIGSCKTPCESKTGVREVFWSEMIVSPARYGGKPCDRQERRWVESEPCKSDQILPCPGEKIKTAEILNLCFSRLRDGCHCPQERPLPMHWWHKADGSDHTLEDSDKRKQWWKRM